LLAARNLLTLLPTANHNPSDDTKSEKSNDEKAILTVKKATK
jgi:hypothetical protein